MAAANRLAAERDKKAREQMKKERRLKQEARDRGEDVSSDDDDNDDDDDDKVVVDMDWGVQLKDKKHLTDLLSALQALKVWGIKGAGIIGAYHARRVAPLMARALPLY